MVLKVPFSTNIVDLKMMVSFQYITNSKAIRRAWEDIAEKYCEDKGVPPIHYKIFSVRWKNQKFYSKKKAKMQELGVTHKELVQIRRDLSNAENSSQPPR